MNQFNEYLLGHELNPFRENTIKDYIQNEPKSELPKFKYIITLDADTDLILNSALELVGAMAHILNRPIIDKTKNVVIDGYGILQPRVGVNLDISYQTLFTQIFAGAGGIDSYTNAISDIYQDNFKEGIFTGKGIYALEVFSEVLKKAIPENTVLSHDLLEGNYLRCGLVSDILLMDGYPTKYNSFMTRLSRWIRGDWQIVQWLKSYLNIGNEKIKNPLNLLSRYKIKDNLRRSLLEISVLISIIYAIFLSKISNINIGNFVTILIVSIILPFLLEIINHFIFKKEGERKQKTFTPKIAGLKGAMLRLIITLGCLPYKAYISIKSIIKTIYRLGISHSHLLEWTTSEEAEKQAKSTAIAYISQMLSNIIIGIIKIKEKNYEKNSNNNMYNDLHINNSNYFNGNIYSKYNIK